MDFEPANHPKNKPILRFSADEIATCSDLTHVEACDFLARIAFASREIPVFTAGLIICEPEKIIVDNGLSQFDPQVAVARAVLERCTVDMMLERYGATIAFDQGVTA